MMTLEEKKAWLGRYRNAHTRLKKLEQQRARAESFGEKSLARHGRQASEGGTDKLRLAVVRMEEIDASMVDLRGEMYAWKEETAMVLATIPKPRYRRVMQYYYIECLSWAEVADLSGYGHRYVQALHRRILEELELPADNTQSG